MSELLKKYPKHNIQQSIISYRHPLIGRETKISSMGSCFARNIKDYFKSNNFITDRVWGDEQKKEEKPLGVRVYLK